MKAIRLILGLYVLAWFTFVVPGHTRGIISLPGAGQSVKCCATDSGDESNSQSTCPTPASPSSCAICFFAASYSLPPVYVFYVEPLELIQTLNDHAIAQLLSLDFPTPYWPVGPPASA